MVHAMSAVNLSVHFILRVIPKHFRFKALTKYRILADQVSKAAQDGKKTYFPKIIMLHINLFVFNQEIKII